MEKRAQLKSKQTNLPFIFTLKKPLAGIADIVFDQHPRGRARHIIRSAEIKALKLDRELRKSQEKLRAALQLLFDLLEGFQNITVLDVSQAAIDVNKSRLRERAREVHWIVADITQGELEPRAYDVWHDRAVFHFLTAPEQRTAYVRHLARSVRSGGHVIVSTFGPESPTKCSGLDVVRYDADSLREQFGSRFRLVKSLKEMHQTPFGTTQQFLYCYCRVE